MVSMVHKELPGRTIEVAPQSVPMHMASGWVPLDNKAVEADEKAAAEEAEAKAEADKAAKSAIAAEEKKQAAATAKAKTAAKES